MVIRIDTQPGGRFLAVNTPLRALLQLTYGVEDFEIVGAPNWAASERFDVDARAGEELAPLEGPGHGSAPLRQMLQALLRDRFSLAAHTESREVPGLALVPLRPNHLGPRLTRSNVDCAARIAKAKPADGTPACGFRMSPGSIVLEGVPISSIASGLTGVLGRRVVDRTGITGNFDLQLHWDRPMRPADGAALPQDGVSLFAALADQAGLRVIQTRVPGTVLVVDHVDRPTPN